VAEHAAAVSFGRLGRRPVELTSLESVMWRAGQDAGLRMTVGALIVLDRPPGAAALRTRLQTAIDATVRLRQRPERAPSARGRTVWVEDRDALATPHLRQLSMAGAADDRQVLDLVALLEALPFDPERSPWDVTLIDGLEHGGAALYVRAHHVLTDGIGGVHLLGLLFDRSAPRSAEPVAAAPAPPQRPPATVTMPRPGTVTLTIDVPAAVRRLLHGMGAARSFDPVGSTLRGSQRALDVVNSASRQLLVLDRAPTGVPDRRSLLSRFDVFGIAGARCAAVALGGSRNDLLVAAAAAGLGAYHEARGAPVSELQLVTPTVQRHGEELGGNWFAPARLTVPTARARRSQHFGVVAERLAQARREPALRLASRIATALGALPSGVLHTALRGQARTVDFAATAVPGLRTERRLCGAVVQRAYPLGSRVGCPLSITAFGNADRLDVGVAVDTEVFPDADELVACLQTAFEEYVATAGSTPDRVV
jgi:WS/DGAT/MGAT family acyltransferase